MTAPGVHASCFTATSSGAERLGGAYLGARLDSPGKSLAANDMRARGPDGSLLSPRRFAASIQRGRIVARDVSSGGKWEPSGAVAANAWTHSQAVVQSGIRDSASMTLCTD